MVCTNGAQGGAEMMHWANGWGWGDWLTMSLMMVVFWGLVIGGIVYVVRGADRRGERQPPAEDRTPARILEERFARGEIDETEYKERRELLTSSHR